MNKSNTKSVTKSEFRTTKIWKTFRNQLKQERNKDELTLKPLRKGWNLHHLDMSEDNYTNLDKNNFRCLNKQSHDTVHFLFRYYQKDPDIISRLKTILDEMSELNKIPLIDKDKGV